MKQGRFAELDALRGIAALAVVIYHFTGHVQRYMDFPYYFRLGEHGVQLFFCISGFVILWTLERSKTLADFAFSRFSRLYPTYWASLLLWTLVSVFVVGNEFWPGGTLANATMLQSFMGVADIDIVYWTLAVELVFYVWMGGFFVTGQLKRVSVVAGAWLSVSAIGAMVERWVAMPDLVNRFLILPHIPYFVAGTMFYLVWRDGAKVDTVAMIVASAFVAAMHGGWLHLGIAAVSFSLLGLAVTGRLRWLAVKPMVFLGTISYALYVTHRNIGYEVLFALERSGVPVWPALLIATGFAVVLAAAVTLLIERPAMKLLRGWYGERSSAPAGTSKAVAR